MSNEKNCYTYILWCNDGTYYTGWTNDLEKRVASHNDGTGSKYTRARRPVELVYVESFETKQEAMRREWEIKHMRRAEKQKLIDSARPTVGATDEVVAGENANPAAKR